MRENRWLALAISLVGILNVVIVWQFYLLNRMVAGPLGSAAASSPAAIGLSRLSAKIESGQIRIQPQAETSAVKNAVLFAVIGLQQKVSESETRVAVSREMLSGTIVVFVLQLLLATMAWARRGNTGADASR